MTETSRQIPEPIAEPRPDNYQPEPRLQKSLLPQGQLPICQDFDPSQERGSQQLSKGEEPVPGTTGPVC
jgi:hypothetical protein